MNQIEIYKGKDNQIQVEVKFENDTFWLTLNQMADIFERDKSVISRHLKNIYSESELQWKATVAKNATVQMEAERKIIRNIFKEGEQENNPACRNFRHTGKDEKLYKA